MSHRPVPGVFSTASAAATEGERKALFLDRDGVINVNHGYVHTPEQTDWVPGIFEFCGMAQDAGYLLVVVTNQAGIARGYYSEEQFLDYTRWVHEQFASRGVSLLATYYCPHHPDAGVEPWRLDCECRKPHPGMLLAAKARFGLSMQDSVLVGDQPSDLAAAAAAGVPRAIMVDCALESPFDAAKTLFDEQAR